MQEPNTKVIDLNENGTYIVSNGKLTPLPVPPSGYGKHEIKWYDGKMTIADNTETIKG